MTRENRVEEVIELMEVYVLIAQPLVTTYDDAYKSIGEGRVVGVTNSLTKAEELREEFNSLPENTNREGIVRVIDIKELELNKIDRKEE